MNTLLWILQVVLALLCISGGIFQIFKLEDLRKGVAAMRAVPRGVWAILGAIGCLGGLCLILPGATDVLPVLTPIAATALAAQSLLISVLYLRHRDTAPMPYSVAMALMAGFIAYGRFSLEPS